MEFLYINILFYFIVPEKQAASKVKQNAFNREAAVLMWRGEGERGDAFRREGVAPTANRKTSRRWLSSPCWCGSPSRTGAQLYARGLVILQRSLANVHWSLVTGHGSLVNVHWPLVTCPWSLVTVHWSMVVTGHWWSLVTGHWALVIILVTKSW